MRSATLTLLTGIMMVAPAPALARAAPVAGSAASGDATDAAENPRDVIVTARRREENAQQVPQSLSVVGGALLDRSYAVNTQQLSQLVPSLNYSSANPRNTAFTIRGLGSSVVAVSQANDGLEPGVGYYVDQVYHARPASAAFDFSDIARIEILRGPQGTLFGKNSTAGAINIVTRAPTFTPEASEELSVGSYRFLQGIGIRAAERHAGGTAVGGGDAARRRDRQCQDRHEGECDRQPGSARSIAVQAGRRLPASRHRRFHQFPE
jgi:iron complex outermembrane receptor protein